MTKEALLNRIEFYQKELKKIEEGIRQMQASHFACSGAISDCHYWLGILDGQADDDKSD